MNAEQPWARLRRLRAAYLVGFVATPIFVGAYYLVVAPFFSTVDGRMRAAFGLHGASVLVLSISLFRQRCPECQQRVFFHDRANVFASACMHCRAPLKRRR